MFGDMKCQMPGLERGSRAETKQTVSGVCLFVGGYALLSLTTQSLAGFKITSELLA